MVLSHYMVFSSSQQKKQLRAIAQKYALNFIVLFGSRAQQFAHKDSDIDIAISSKKPLDYPEEFLLHRELSKVFNTNHIDLVLTTDASPLLLYNLAFKSQLLCENTKSSFAYFQMYAFKRYVEAKPLYALQKSLLRSA